MTLIITGNAGFIGFHLAKACLERGETIIGIDNLNDYYDVRLKLARLELLKSYRNFIFYETDICDHATLNDIFTRHKPKKVIHLAAQAGVRYSLINPNAYVQSNLVGFSNIIESCRHHNIEHLIYASTSSVYGANSKQPYRESDSVNHPLTLYSASKKANELIAHAYAHLYQLPTTGLRFFTVYGPWGRPDMAFFSFTKHILAGNPIQVFNHGNMQRDFTYIDDIIAGLMLVIENPASRDLSWSSHSPNPATSYAPYRIYNIGYGQPVTLMDYIEAIEKATGKKAIKELMPIQDGDVVSTHADTSLLATQLGYSPKIAVKEGINRFVEWYRAFYSE